MATYTITPVGGAEADGCAEVTHIRTLYTIFGENDFAFVRQKALKGILEGVVVKDVIVGYITGFPIVNYKDTWNALWNDGELVTESAAIDLAVLYYERLIEVGLPKLELCSS